MSPPRHVFVQQGEIHGSKELHIFKTVLGSCISVCLWDPVRQIGGLNHFVLPRAQSGGDSTRFGNIAVPRLVGLLQEPGCTSMAAKVFGGAAVLPMGSLTAVGDSNTDMALALMHEHGIPMVAQRTGGRLGIVIRYFSASGDVQLRELSESGRSNISPASRADRNPRRAAAPEHYWHRP